MVIAEFTRGCNLCGVSDGIAAINALKVRGHAGYAAHGEDVVCAAVSALVYTAAGALGVLCGAPGGCVIERDGFYEINVPVFQDSGAEYKASIIMETAYIGFKQIEASYPKFLTVSERYT
jgi:uncharacterized protein YsxB (DUF464 family)